MCILWICANLRERKRRIEMARSIFAQEDCLYWEARYGHGFSERFYKLYKACWDHRLDVLYTATTMQAQQKRYPQTGHEQVYLWHYIRKDDFSDPKQNVLDIVGAGGKEYVCRLFYHHNKEHPLLPIWDRQYKFNFMAWTQACENLIAQGVFPLENPGVDRNEVNTILHYFREETRDTLRFRANRKEPEKVVHFYHLLQVNIPDRWPRTEVTKPGRSDAAESADSTLPVAAVPDSSHRALTESELEGLCASILTETFPEVCVTDAVIPEPHEHMELEPTALQWCDPTGKTFSPLSQLVPISLVTVHHFSGVSSPSPLVVLFDCGSQLSFLKRGKVPKECKISTVEQPVRGLTGSLHLTEEVTLTGIMLPEFSASKRIDSSLRCLLLDEHQEDSTYDMILGLDFLCAVGIDILCRQKQLKWNEATLTFQPHDTYKEPQANIHARLIEAFTYGDEEGDPKGLGYKLTQIMEAKYEAIDTDELAQAQKQLTPTQRTDLARLFRKFPQLFDGELRTYPHCQYHLDLQVGSKPVHSHPYGVPFMQCDAFKHMLDHLVKIGVLERSGASQWASSTFIIPKKDGCVRWISDFRALNKCIKRKTYPLPCIAEILSKRTGYTYFSKLDISMAFYTFELDNESKDLCTINTPYGLYCYRVLPLDIAQSPDFCQETMEHILQGIMDANVYINDIGCFGKSWAQHLQVLEQVMTHLQDNGFSVNPRKCEWAVQETDFLGYWLTPTGLKPWRKKIDAILRLQRPCTVKDQRSFIGAVTYYRTMFPQRAHILAPLTALTSQKSGTVV